MPEFRTISREEWEQYPSKAAGKPDEWEPVLAALETGEIVEVPVSDDKQLRGMRIGLGRRAKSRGWQLEYRAKDSALAVQKIGERRGEDTVDLQGLEPLDTEREEPENTEAPKPAAPARRGRRKT